MSISDIIALAKDRLLTKQPIKSIDNPKRFAKSFNEQMLEKQVEDVEPPSFIDLFNDEGKMIGFIKGYPRSAEVWVRPDCVTQELQDSVNAYCNQVQKAGVTGRCSVRRGSFENGNLMVTEHSVSVKLGDRDFWAYVVDDINRRNFAGKFLWAEFRVTQYKQYKPDTDLDKGKFYMKKGGNPREIRFTEIRFTKKSSERNMRNDKNVEEFDRVMHED